MTRFEKMEGYPDEIQGRFNSFITTQFDDSLSVEMQIRSLIKWISSSRDLINNMVDYINLFIEMFDERLQQEIVGRLNDWLEDGTLAQIINNDVFDMKADKTFVDSEIERLDQLINSEIERLDQFVDSELERLDQQFNTFKTISNEKFISPFIDIKFVEKKQEEINDHERFKRAIDMVKHGGTVLITENITIDNMLIPYDNVVIKLVKGNLCLEGLTFSGNNSGIIGEGGHVKGKLKVAKLSQNAEQGTNVLTFENHSFEVGDNLYSSYGLHTGVTNEQKPVPITEIMGNSVLTESPTKGLLPKGAMIGTYSWARLLKSSGENNFFINFNIDYARGYAIEAVNGSVRIEEIRMNNNGLDLTRIADNVKAKFKRCYFGTIFDPAKQAISLTNNADLTIQECVFNRDNSDVEIYVFEYSERIKLKIKDSIFIATKTNTHPAPYNKNSFAVINMRGSNNTHFEKIEFIGCKFVDYAQGVITEPIGATVSMNVDSIYIENCDYIKTQIGTLLLTSVKNYTIKNCYFDSENELPEQTTLIQNNKESEIKITDTVFKNLYQTVTLNYGVLTRCVFEHVNLVNIRKNIKGYDNTFINSPVRAYPNWEATSHLSLYGTKIGSDEPRLTGNADTFHTIFNIIQKRPVHFELLNGSLKAVAYKTDSNVKYFVQLESWDGTISGLKGDDWMVPNHSTFTQYNQFDGNKKYRTVTKSVASVTSGTHESGSTSILLSGTWNFATGDYVNILLDNNDVHTTKITNVSGNTITIANAIPSNTSDGARVCAFSLNSVS